MKLLLYCTKAKPYLIRFGNEYGYNQFDTSYCKDEHISPYEYGNEVLNGKIVAECDFEVEEIEKGYGTYHASFDKKGYFDDYYDYMTKTIDEDILLKRSCLNIEELETYNPNYAIHIKNLHIFDEPKELEYFESYKNDNYSVIEKAPQNMMYAYYITKNYADTIYEKPFVRYTYDKYILISIRPQWLCKILNGEKTIEVRKKVLKEML